MELTGATEQSESFTIHGRSIKDHPIVERSLSWLVLKQVWQEPWGRWFESTLRNNFFANFNIKNLVLSNIFCIFAM